mmetsp:Transcript_41988/g.105016  ORF Transcript_41988/g.105016 Transcript_41988/m.105016 type:complete len:227 (+) Transcript_41988:900-1580(+)
MPLPLPPKLFRRLRRRRPPRGARADRGIPRRIFGGTRRRESKRFEQPPRSHTLDLAIPHRCLWQDDYPPLPATPHPRRPASQAATPRVALRSPVNIPRLSSSPWCYSGLCSLGVYGRQRRMLHRQRGDCQPGVAFSAAAGCSACVCVPRCCCHHEAGGGGLAAVQDRAPGSQRGRRRQAPVDDGPLPARVPGAVWPKLGEGAGGPDAADAARCGPRRGRGGAQVVP